MRNPAHLIGSWKRYNALNRQETQNARRFSPRCTYVEAQRAAEASGLSVESIVAEAVKIYLHDDLDTLDKRLTPQVIACLDRASAQADAGIVMTFDQYEAQFQLKREAWLREQATSQ